MKALVGKLLGLYGRRALKEAKEIEDLCFLILSFFFHKEYKHWDQQGLYRYVLEAFVASSIVFYHEPCKLPVKGSCKPFRQINSKIERSFAS